MATPTQDQVDEVLNQCAEAADTGNSKYPGMSYEQGVEYALRWMMDNGPHPLED